MILFEYHLKYPKIEQFEDLNQQNKKTSIIQRPSQTIDICSSNTCVYNNYYIHDYDYVKIDILGIIISI